MQRTLTERVGAVLREMREDQGTGLSQFAKDVGMSKGHISRLETGQYCYRLEVLDVVATALEVSVAQVLERAEELL